MIIKEKKLHINASISLNFLTSITSSYDELLFFDIETTGLYWKNTVVYLIGVLVYREEEFTLCQYFAQTPEEEGLLLEQFVSLAKSKTYFIQYNGNGFDVPYLQHKFTQYQLSNPFENKTQIDLYKRFSPLKKVLQLDNCKQKELERFLGYPRKDRYSGKELIQEYKFYAARPSHERLEAILLHNRDDLCGMVATLSLNSYQCILKGNFELLEANLVDEDCFLLLVLQLSHPLPKLFSVQKEKQYLHGEGNILKLMASIQDGYLRLYYEDYKNYYYLPYEDTAIHKSVGAYVDKEHRIPAARDTCYQKISCTPDFLENKEQVTLYAKSLITYLFQG